MIRLRNIKANNSLPSYPRKCNGFFLLWNGHCEDSYKRTLSLHGPFVSLSACQCKCLCVYVCVCVTKMNLNPQIGIMTLVFVAVHQERERGLSLVNANYR